MSENVEAKVVESEELSIQEKEELVQEKAGTTFEDGMYKVDLTQPPVEQTEQTENAIQEQEPEGSVLREDESAEEAGEKTEVELQEVRQEEVKEETEEVVLEELPAQEEQEETIKEVEELTEQVEQAIVESDAGIKLPENIQKVVDFMNETGGTLEDYVALNKDYSSADDLALLREYYQQSKPHLSSDEIDFLIEDKFTFDEDVDDERDVKRKS